LTTIRKHLTYANVMATIATFIALGGGAYAATHLPRNSVGTPQLRRNAVTGSKVRDGSLSGRDIKSGSITAANLGRIGLANMLGASGTATNDASVSESAGSCGRYAFVANGAQPGDAVMLAGSDINALSHAMIGAPTVTNPNKMNVSVCAGAGSTVNQGPGTIQLRFSTLR